MTGPSRKKSIEINPVSKIHSLVLTFPWAPLCCTGRFRQGTSFGKRGRRRKSRGRDLQTSTFWLSQVLVCLEAQYDAVNEPQSSAAGASSPSSGQMCWQHGTFLKGTCFYGTHLPAKHEWLRAFGFPMYFQAKSSLFMPNIQRQYQTEMKTISL